MTTDRNIKNKILALKIDTACGRSIVDWQVSTPLRKKCPNTEIFLVRIFSHSEWIRRDTSYLSVFSPNAGKYGPEKTPHLDTFQKVLANVFSCNFAFIFNLKMYKEAITGEFFCTWQNLLWTTKTWRHSILLSLMKLKIAESWNCWNFCKFFWLYQWKYLSISFSVLRCIVLPTLWAV